MSAPEIGAWTLARTEPGAWADPSADADAGWLPAIVPGTAGAALRAAERWKPEDEIGLDAFDVWYRSTIRGDGPAILRFEGLATIAEVYLDGAPVLASDNMFLAHEIELVLSGDHRLDIAFRSLDVWLAGKKGRARWRPRLVRPPTLRFARTLLLGHIPGWGPPIHAVGPYRSVSLIEAGRLRIVATTLAATLDGKDGLLDVAVRLSAPTRGWVTARCGTIDFVLVDEGDGMLRGRCEVPEVERWWPHTHGEPALYPVQVFVGDHDFDLGKVGFRTLAIDRDIDGKGFGFLVNDVPVFCRGACWTCADIVALPFSREAILPLMTLARDAGMNMIRVGGTMGYQGDAFHAICDELGLLVWQDFAFSNFDYPANDPAFVASVTEEARQFLARTQGSASLAVLCGASEVAQQASMLGMPAALWSNSLFDGVLADLSASLRPDVPYTPHSPWGGELPFVANEGISHYYGVSAHCRPVEEARRAHVRFSAESLGFANVPDVARVTLAPDEAATVQPIPGERSIYETSALYGFESIRNHYCAALYGVDVERLRRDDPDRYIDLSRATTAEVMEETYAEWRSAGSPTRGALVWWLRDIEEGAGWGVLDALNEPKAAYHALKRAFRPVTVVLTDENLNGLKVSLINETAMPRAVTLTLACLRDGATVVMRASTDVELAPRSTIAVAASTLWGGFFDTTYAFKFGEPSHEVTVASLLDQSDGALIAEAFHFPLGRGHDRHDLGLAVQCEHGPSGPTLHITTQRLAQSVHIVCDGHRPMENWFHLAPGSVRHVPLVALGAGDLASGYVTALNATAHAPF